MKKLAPLCCVAMIIASGPAIRLAAQDQAGHMMGLTRIQQHVTSRRVSSFDRSGGNSDRYENIKPGESLTLFNEKGAGIINHIWITMGPTPVTLSRNDVILRIFWDGNDYPSVEAPVGPFFGQGWNESYEFTSLPLSAGPKDGRSLVSYFAMPFAKGARIEIENQADKSIQFFYYYIDYTEVSELPQGTGRFHAWFNAALMKARPGKEVWRAVKNIDGGGNYVVANLQGKGHFVGVNYYVHSPSPLWYGEGDDMVYIDESALPSLNGTGTEDYFNTAWCPKTLYSHPYYGIARASGDFGWMGRTHYYRFHIADPIHFNKSLRFTFEHGHGNTKTLHLASVAYWYQDVAAKIPPAPSKAERAPRPLVLPGDVETWRDVWMKNAGAGAHPWED